MSDATRRVFMSLVVAAAGGTSKAATTEERTITKQQINNTLQNIEVSGYGQGEYGIGPYGGGTVRSSSEKICPGSTEVPLNGTTDMGVTLDGFEDGFAGGEFEFSFPDIVSPESVTVSNQLGLSSTNIDNQTVVVQVSDSQQNYQGQLSDATLCTIQLRGNSEGSGTVNVTPVQVDDDRGRSVGLTVERGCGEITVTQSCPTVDGTRTTDPDGDGICEDFNGNERVDFDDVNTFFNNVDNDDVTSNAESFDFNGNGRIDFDDINTFFEQLT